MIAHAANSAAVFRDPAAHFDLARCGIAVYGLDPSPALRGRIDLRPALALKAHVTLVKVVPAGEALSYGLRHRLAADSVVATVPLGYADGVTRRLSQVGAEVLVGGRRRPMVGTVTMDQLLVDCGPASGADALGVRWGDEVVLLGEQHGGRIGAEEWAERLDTISYEVVSGISPRAQALRPEAVGGGLGPRPTRLPSASPCQTSRSSPSTPAPAPAARSRPDATRWFSGWATPTPT